MRYCTGSAVFSRDEERVYPFARLCPFPDARFFRVPTAPVNASGKSITLIKMPQFLSLKLCQASLLLLFVAFVSACGTAAKQEAEEEEALSRTEFTGRIENFFEYAPLKAGKPSQFLIHLTDLSDGTPVEKADVTLTIRKADGGGTASEVKAKVGRVTGIYVAEVELPEKGKYDIEFRVKNEKLDERLPLKDFEVE